MTHLPCADRLYPSGVDLGKGPRAKPPGLGQVREGGFIDFVGPRPVYMEPSLEGPAMDMMSRLNQRLYDYFGIVLPYGYLKIRKERLPAYVVDLDGRGRYAWKKILGEYRPATMEMTIDDGLGYGEVMRVLGHELVHYAQHLLGGLHRYMRKYGSKGVEYIECAADRLNDGLLMGARRIGRKQAKAGLTGM